MAVHLDIRSGDGKEMLRLYAIFGLCSKDCKLVTHYDTFIKNITAVYIIKLKDVCLDYVKSLNKTRMNKLPILKNLSPALKQKSTCSVETTHNNIKKRAETITRKVQLGGLPFV